MVIPETHERDGPAAVATATEFAGRFHYWRGLSGSRYLHTVFALEHCPELPDAVYVAARRRADGSRRALAIGRVAPIAGLTFTEAFRRDIAARGGDEIHLHLLAASAKAAAAVIEDLRGAHGDAGRLPQAEAESEGVRL